MFAHINAAGYMSDDAPASLLLLSGSSDCQMRTVENVGFYFPKQKQFFFFFVSAAATDVKSSSVWVCAEKQQQEFKTLCCCRMQERRAWRNELLLLER